jgi:hypothetical protein
MRTRALLIILFVVAVSLIAVTPVAAAPVAGGPAWHQVVWGETLSSIGRRYNVSPWAIASANGIANPNRIYAGQWLHIPAGPPYYGPRLDLHRAARGYPPAHRPGVRRERVEHRQGQPHLQHELHLGRPEAIHSMLLK